MKNVVELAVAREGLLQAAVDRVLASTALHRHALASESGIKFDELERWDRMLLLADRAWSFRDQESLDELVKHVVELLAGIT